MSQLDHDEPTTGIDPLQELGKQLPWDRPDASRREAVRSSLLVAASDSPPRRSGRAILVGAGFVAGALAAAAVALLLVRSSSPSSSPAPIASTERHENYATIESSSVAELEHTSTTTPTGSDEVVRIRAGKVRLAVPAVRSGDRVRTKTGDAEVEGTGAYEVVVANDKLTSVRVASGTAKVIVDGQTIVLASGETWTAPVITADLSPVPAPAEAPDPMVAPAPTPTAATPDPTLDPESIVVAKPAPRIAARPTETVQPEIGEIKPAGSGATPSKPTATPPSSPTATPSRPSITTSVTPSIATKPTSSGERHFQAGWALLRDHKYAAAADELALAAAGTGPLASDARYFQAVALTKAGRAKDAEAALVAFLDGAPTSTRRGRASVMLGRLIAARGDTKSARAWFTAALADPDASVAGAAKAELSRLEPSR